MPYIFWFCYTIFSWIFTAMFSNSEKMLVCMIKLTSVTLSPPEFITSSNYIHKICRTFINFVRFSCFYWCTCILEYDGRATERTFSLCSARIICSCSYCLCTNFVTKFTHIQVKIKWPNKVAAYFEMHVWYSRDFIINWVNICVHNLYFQLTGSSLMYENMCWRIQEITLSGFIIAFVCYFCSTKCKLIRY